MSRDGKIPPPDGRYYAGPEARHLVVSVKLRPAEKRELVRLARESGVPESAAVRYALTLLPGWSPKGGE